MNIFITGFWVLIVICVILFLYTWQTVKGSNDAAFRQFQRVYLTVYLFAMAGDWLQGPYVYALYDFYGMKTHDIEVLFVAGFGSSMLFGTVVGSFADKYGRRANCILYGILYGLSCVTKHFNNFYILMVGRLLGGIATSILYSAFESWLICEHNKRNFDSDLLGSVFSHAVLGNSLIAIGCGLVAQQAADIAGYVAPFDCAMVVMVLMCVVIVFTWSENHGDVNVDISASFASAFKSIRTDRKILCLGLIQSLFEGSMYTFVLEWTPALTPAAPSESTAAATRHLLEDTVTKSNDGHRGTIPHGYIFAAFMVAIMIGSSIFKILSKYASIESFMRLVLFIAALSLLTPIIFKGNQLVIFIGFLVFETCVGIFWPSLSTMRGRYVPEATRATIMNCFRVPLNLIVVFILTQNFPMDIIFKCCVGFLTLATVFQQWLFRCVQQTPSAPRSSKSPPSSSGDLEVGDATEDKQPLIVQIEEAEKQQQAVGV